MEHFKEEAIVNSEPVEVYSISIEFANKLVELELLKIEIRNKNIKIDTTIEDEGD